MNASETDVYDQYRKHTEELTLNLPKPSRTTAMPLGPITSREEAEVLIDQAAEALASAAEGIATIIADLVERRNLILRRRSSLQRVANLLEKGTWKPPQYCQPEFGQELTGADRTPAEVAQSGSVAELQAELALSLRGLE